MVYLNCAATSYPKPEIVIHTLTETINALPSGQFRSVGIFGNEDVFPECRKRIAQILGVERADRIYFTSGSTESLNVILRGLGLSADQVVTTATEHNSVLRPLFNMDDTKPVIVPCDESGLVDPEKIKEAISGRTRAIVVNHCSNVTGAIQDAAAIGEIAKARGLYFVLDCSQSAGCIPIRGDAWKADAIAFTGHKSLFGVQGTGGYFVREGINLEPLKYGGTGRDSRIISYEDAPLEYEVGTQNSPGIAALNAAAGEVLRQGVEEIHEKERELGEYLIRQVSAIDGVKVYGQNLSDRGPVVSISIDGMKCGDAAYILQNGYDVITRAGLSCAPLIHRYIGSGEDGTLRLSFSQYTTREDLDTAITGIRDIAASLRESGALQ